MTKKEIIHFLENTDLWGVLLILFRRCPQKMNAKILKLPVGRGSRRQYLLWRQMRLGILKNDTTFQDFQSIKHLNEKYSFSLAACTKWQHRTIMVLWDAFRKSRFHNKGHVLQHSSDIIGYDAYCISSSKDDRTNIVSGKKLNETLLEFESNSFRFAPDQVKAFFQNIWHFWQLS